MLKVMPLATRVNIVRFSLRARPHVRSHAQCLCSHLVAECWMFCCPPPAPAPWRAALRATPKGFIVVNTCLQSVTHPDVFGGGDCVHMAERPMPKVGPFSCAAPHCCA